METTADDTREASDTPRVSICVTAYNHGSFIRQCLQSLVDQRSTSPFEVVVGEDCSTDDTRAVVLEFARRYPAVVRPLLPERNLGMFANYRTVQAAARGEFICHCDGDDAWEPGKLEAEVAFLDANPQCVAVFTNAWVMSEDGTRVGVFSRGVPPSFDTSYLIRDGNFLHHSSMMYRSRLRESALPAQGPFIDFQVYVRLARHGALGYIDQLLTSYRGESAASAIGRDNSGVRRLVWQALCDVQPVDASPGAIRQAQASFLADAAYQALRSGQPRHYLPWLQLVRAQVRGSALLATQLKAGFVLMRNFARKLGFHLAVKAGFAKRTARVFYPK